LAGRAERSCLEPRKASLFGDVSITEPYSETANMESSVGAENEQHDDHDEKGEKKEKRTSRACLVCRKRKSACHL